MLNTEMELFLLTMESEHDPAVIADRAKEKAKKLKEVEDTSANGACFVLARLSTFFFSSSVFVPAVVVA